MIENVARPDAAIENLTNHQQQADIDGTFVKVSRQALDEVLSYLAAMQQAQEPVAWKNYAEDGDWWLTDDREPADSCERSVPLYPNPPVPQWQGIESAPRDGTLILVPVGHGVMDVVSWWGGAWRETANALAIRDEPTHWMPLPTPPAAGGSDAE